MSLPTPPQAHQAPQRTAQVQDQPAAQEQMTMAPPQSRPHRGTVGLRGGDGQRSSACPGRFCFCIPCPIPCDFCVVCC